MKKILLFIAALFMVVCTTGCGSVSDDKDLSLSSAKQESTLNSSNKTTNNTQEEPQSKYVISIRSKDQLNELRNSLSKSEKENKNYYDSIEGGSVQSKEDVVLFLNLIESLPVIDFFDGEISWICYDAGISADTNEFNESAYITVKSDKDWARFEYQLDDENSSIMTKVDQFSSDLEEEVCNKTNTVKLYSETIKEHSSGSGNIITWNMIIQDFPVTVVYYSSDEKNIDIKKIINESEPQLVLNSNYK